MTSQPAPKVRNAVSTAELERRWKAARQAMKAKGLDFLITQATLPNYHGYVKWLADVSVSGNPVTVIFPREEEMTLISHGPRPPSEPNPPASAVRGVKKRLNMPYILAMNYTNIYDAELVVNELKAYKNARIGFVGMGFLSTAFYLYVTRNLSSAKFEDATNMIDNIKVIKSAEEIQFTRETCQMQDTILQWVPTVVRPGRREFEVRADILHKGLQLGATTFALNAKSSPADGSKEPGSPRDGTRILKQGDKIDLLLETDGPGGFWGEAYRTYCIGKPPAEMYEQLEFVKKAHKLTVDALKPGGDPMAFWEANNAYLRSINSEEERRIYAHGQGYDMMERPSLNPGESMKLAAGMNIAVHPVTIGKKAGGWICDNYIVTASGPAERLHKTPQEFFII